METNLPDHRLFKDFKHIDLGVDLTLCWPPAAGGHFICNAISEVKNLPNQLNEYGHGDSLWNYLDLKHLNYIEPTEMDEYLNNVYDIAVNFDSTKDTKILRTHRYPILLSKTFSYRSKEIVIIYPDEESRRFLSILSVIKHRFNPYMGAWNIADIVDRVSEAKIKVYGEDIISLTEKVNSYCGLELFDRMIIWDYFLHCKEHKLVSTKSIFNEFMKYTFDNGVNFGSEVSQDTLSSVVRYLSQFGNCAVINYSDLFFKLKIPIVGSLSKLKKTEVYNYSRTNLDLMTDFLSLVDDNEAADIKTYIDSMSISLTENLNHVIHISEKD